MRKGDSPVLFLRRTTKVERRWSPLDGFLYNTLTMNVAVMFTIPFLYAVAYYPTGNLSVAILITGVFCTAEAIVYAFLASSMPRSGGDYVFQSRLLSGAVGTVFAFTGVVLSGAMWMAIGGWFAAKVAVAPFLVLFGLLFDSASLVRAGKWFLTDHGLFAISLLVVGWAGLVNVWGMKAYARLQRIFWATGALALASLLVLLLLSDRTSFVSAFDQLANEAFGVSGAYGNTIYRAIQLGYSPTRDPGILGGTVALLPVAAFVLIYPAWSVQQGGEIKRASSLREQMKMIVAAEIVTAAVAALVLGLAVDRFGKEFLGASAYLFFSHPEALPLPVAPFFGLFMGALEPAPLSMFLAALLFNAWFWMWAPDITLAASRVLLAMASDRLLPAWVGEVGRRSKAPVKAILAFSGVCGAAALLYAYTDFWLLTLDAALLNVLAFAVTCGAAAAFPFTKRELYRDSTAARYEVLGVPAITIAGGVFIAFTLFLMWRFLIDDALGVNVPISLLFVVGLYAFSLALYFGFRRYRRTREGVDIEVTYREIPVE